MHPGWRYATARLALLLLVGILAGCGPAKDRPLSGAQPGASGPTPPGVPPTLQPSDALRLRPLASPSPGIAGAANPSAEPSPARSPIAAASPSVVTAPPIVRTIAPAANARVADPGPVSVSAILVGRGSDLATAGLALNGADAGAQIDKRTAREWTIHVSLPLGPGSHTAKVQVRDASGQAGGFTWQFDVGPAESPAVAPSPQAAPRP